MNEQVSQKSFINDAAFRDAEKRVLGNILTEFQNLSKDELEKKVNANIEFLGNKHIGEIIGIPHNIKIESFEYIIGKTEFDEVILSNTCAKMEGKWVISVDESMIDTESFVGEVMYRHSCAFGYKIPKISEEKTLPKEERILAVSSILRLQDEEDFDRKKAFLTYILNLYVAFYTAKILQSKGEPIHAIILHGPLIRQISPFLTLIFREDDVRRVVTADTAPLENTTEEIENIAKGGLLDLIVSESTYRNMLENDFIDLFPNEHVNIAQKKIAEGGISGIGFYFSLLRMLSDLAKNMGFHLISCVENPRSKEYSSLYVQYQIEHFVQDSDNEEILRQLFDAYNVNFNKQDIRNNFRTLIHDAGWDDEMIHSFSLKFDNKQSIKSEFTQPVPIRRYFTGRRNKRTFGFTFGATSRSEIGAQDNLINRIVDTFFPFESYRMLMSYVRTSALRAPIRVEFLEQVDEENWKELLATIYISSLPYGSYGLPIFLYYVDKIARMPKEIISLVTESYLWEQVTKVQRQKPLSDETLSDVLLGVTGLFRRDFHDRK